MENTKSEDFNSSDFRKKVESIHKDNRKRISTKNIDARDFKLNNVSSLLKNNIIQIAIFLLVYFAVSGIVGNFILLFTKPIYFLGSITIGIILYFIFKKQISKKFKF